MKQLINKNIECEVRGCITLSDFKDAAFSFNAEFTVPKSSFFGLFPKKINLGSGRIDIPSALMNGARDNGLLSPSYDRIHDLSKRNCGGQGRCDGL